MEIYSLALFIQVLLISLSQASPVFPERSKQDRGTNRPRFVKLIDDGFWIHVERMLSCFVLYTVHPTEQPLACMGMSSTAFSHSDANHQGKKYKTLEVGNRKFFVSPISNSPTDCGLDPIFDSPIVR